MNTKQYKYIIAFVLAIMTQPMMAQDYMNIFFKNGDFRKFYMKNITEIVATKVDAEGVEHEDYNYQQITTIYDKYVYKLEDVDSITFTKIDEELAEQNFVSAMPQVFSAIEDCETISDVEKKIDQIKNADGVADAWSDGHELHVSIEEGETFSFHFNHNAAGLEDNYSDNLIAQVRAMKPQFTNMLKDDGTPLKVLITDQQSKDESKNINNSTKFNHLIQEFAKCGIIVDYPKDPSVDFFYNNSEDPDNLNFYDYDIVLLSTHGGYGPISYNRPEKEYLMDGEIIAKEAKGLKGHYFYTSEEIGEPIDCHKENSWADKYKTFQEWRDKKQYGDVTDVHISFDFAEEERGGQKVYVAYPTLTEYFFRDIAKGHFKNPNSIFHNAACQSLMGESSDHPSYSFANILYNKGLGVYLGYTETNMSGQRGGCELLFNMALGNSIKASYEKLPAWCKLESLENIENNVNDFIILDNPKRNSAQKVINHYRENPPSKAELKIRYSDNTTVSDSFFLFPTFTVSKDNAQANEEYSGKGQVTISGLTALSSINDGVSAGFYYSTNPFRLNQKVKAEMEIVSDSDNGNCRFKAQLTNLEPDKTYYYRAYTFDDFNYNWGETMSFTTPKPAETEIITFADQRVKELCVKKWDTNGDGELSKEEAMAVKDLGTLFKYERNVSSFNELQYFTGLTSIGKYAFDDCNSLTSIVIPNSVTSIGYEAFSFCRSLTSISIPNSVTSIGSYAFKYCEGLTSITIPNSVTSIGSYAFYECSGLTSVAICSGVTSIGSYAFIYCKGLTSISIPNSVTFLGDGAFKDCSGLTSVAIGSGVTSIGEEVFCFCENLTSINIPNGVTTIGADAFKGCSSLTSIAIPNSVTSIGVRAFTGCKGLTSITIPNGVTKIGKHTFSECRGLTSIVIPNSVTSIGWQAFECCNSVTSITIGSGVISISSDVFTWCNKLTDVYCLAENIQSADNNAFVYSPVESATLHVPAASLDNYKNKGPWKYFGTIVGF